MKYKIEISVVKEEEHQKTAEVYVNDKTAECLSWTQWYSLEQDQKKAFRKSETPTGETEVNRREDSVYVQEVEDLDIGELAVFINRAR